MFAFYVLKGHDIKNLVNTDYYERLLLHYAMEEYIKAFDTDK
jgi:hypothetical protein